jgi:DNA helicase-2/ATP-dependent DNA helicase PcrA
MIEHIEKHSILEFVVNSVATKRAKQKDGSINENIKDSIIKKSTKKVAILKYISKEYSDIDKFINSTVLNGGELSSGAGVSLYSIHASKGLEFKEVYIIDLMDGRFPNRSLMSKGGSLEEERRLFYVAVTRAKDILCLSFAKYDRIKKLDFVPSPFLVEAKLVTK